MNPFERWFTETAAEIARDDDDSPRAVTTTLEQRVAIGLIQARAAECRAIAGQIQVSGLTLRSQVAASIVATLSEQSHRYEQLALQLCDQWPPSEPPAEVCECGHTVSQHSREGDVIGPCSACSCKKWVLKLSTTDNPVVN